MPIPVQSVPVKTTPKKLAEAITEKVFPNPASLAYLGIDPGKSGGVAMLTPSGSALVWKLPETATDQLKVLTDALSIATALDLPLVCCLEQISFVHESMSKMAALKLGTSYGILRGLLTGRISYREVRPAVWQRKLSCLTKGDKKVTYALAQQLYPLVKVTHHVADALLIARYCQLTWT